MKKSFITSGPVIIYFFNRLLTGGIFHQGPIKALLPNGFTYGALDL